MAVALTELAKATPLYERAYHVLQARIVAGLLRPGQRLVDTQLAGQLGISRTPVRDALRQLVRDRLVETDAAGRYYVATPSRQAFLEFCACRELLEPEAARLASEHASEEDLARIAESLDHSSTSFESGDVASAARGTIDFHNALAAATHNQLLAELLQSLRARVLVLRGMIFANAAGADATNREHRAIYAAVRDRDADAAAIAALDHIRGDRERGLRTFDRAVPGAEFANPL